MDVLTRRVCHVAELELVGLPEKNGTSKEGVLSAEAHDLLDLSSGDFQYGSSPRRDLISCRSEKMFGLTDSDDEVRVHVKPVGSHTESDGLSDAKNTNSTWSRSS